MYSHRRPAGMLTYDLHMEKRKQRHIAKLTRGQDVLALLSPSSISDCYFKCMQVFRGLRYMIGRAVA